MHIVSAIEEIPRLPLPCTLTIGSFDGLHLGHLALLRRLREHATSNGSIAVFTFANHPAHLLNNRSPLPLLSTPEHKLLLLEQAGVDLVVLQEFTPDFAAQTYAQFLEKMSMYFPFSYLVLGEGATLGKNRQGDQKAIKELGKKWNFEAEYLPKISYEGSPISSGRIRACIQQGNLEEAAALLGRPYSLYGIFHAESHRKGSLFLAGLCTLPAGRYAVAILHKGKHFQGTAEIGGDSLKMFVEIDDALALSGQYVEIVFGN